MKIKVPCSVCGKSMPQIEKIYVRKYQELRRNALYDPLRALRIRNRKLPHIKRGGSSLERREV